MLPKLTAIVDPFLTEVNFGYNLLCYEDDELVHTFVFAYKDDAELAKVRWEEGRCSLGHIVLQSN